SGQSSSGRVATTAVSPGDERREALVEGGRQCTLIFAVLEATRRAFFCWRLCLLLCPLLGAAICLQAPNLPLPPQHGPPPRTTSAFRAWAQDWTPRPGSH